MLSSLHGLESNDLYRVQEQDHRLAHSRLHERHEGNMAFVLRQWSQRFWSCIRIMNKLRCRTSGDHDACATSWLYWFTPRRFYIDKTSLFTQSFWIILFQTPPSLYLIKQRRETEYPTLKIIKRQDFNTHLCLSMSAPSIARNEQRHLRGATNADS